MGPERRDEDLAKAALAKQRRGVRPTRDETRALARVQKRLDEQQRAKYYAAIPKKTWGDWSGRAQKILNEQSRRYGLPIGGATIDLAEVVRWLHNFLADNAHKLARDDEREPDTAELIKREQLAARQLERKRLEGSLLDRAQVRAALLRVAALIRKAGENLQKHHGPGALETLNDALSDADRELDDLFPHALSGGDDGNPP